MLISFDYLFKQYNIKAKGVLHIGANTGQENEAYRKNGIEHVMWIEADPETFRKLEENLSGTPNSYYVNACIGDEEGKEVTFHLSNNERQSSSFLELGTHTQAHPEVHYTDSFVTKMKRIDNLFYEKGLNMKDFSFLNIDIQGAELMALKGMGKLLMDIDYAYLEVNQKELYIGCALIEEIDAYMNFFDFARVETLWAGNTGWGDALYVRRNII